MDELVVANDIPVGPFLLKAPVGRGAMGEVWSAVHQTQNVRVAVKILHASHGMEPSVRAAFHNEVRSVARLHHPGIVMVLDYGSLTREAEEASGGRLLRDSLYLAMDYASGGTLPRPRSPLSWPRLRALILELLDALAHAHARGVVHRDLKPGNILIATPADGRAGLRLTDFGIARALGLVDQNAGVVSGTPYYMAPEQILNQTRDQGPWTDLYSMGCLAYQFATGRRMFPGTKGTDLLRSQVYDSPKPVRSPHLPEGFQSWLGRMLAKRPSDRFQLAADAAWSLASLGDPREPDLRPTLPPWEQFLADENDEPSSSSHAIAVPGRLVASLNDPNPALDLLSELGGGDTIRVDLEQVVHLSSENVVPVEAATISQIFVSPWDLAKVALASPPSSITDLQPPFSESWRRLEGERPSLRLVGAGLGLFGLRTIPLVDRERERDVIWQSLHRVSDSRRAEFILLQGGAGYGKSRLVEWLCRRASELGAAVSLRATHSPITGPSDGLGPMIAAHLDCVGLSRKECLQRVTAFVREHPLARRNDADIPALVETMGGFEEQEDDDKLPRVFFTNPEERYGVIARFIERTTHSRALILFLDDVHCGADSLAFVKFLMELQDIQSQPVLILATARDDLLGKRPDESALLHELATMPNVYQMPIGPLQPADHTALVGELLGLEGELVGEVAARTAGNPLFAIQLVGDWVSKGLLTVKEGGFALKANARQQLPDSIHGLWKNRLDELLASSNAVGFTVALEIAAALGKDFHPKEWEICCQLAGVSIDWSIVEKLLATHLLERGVMGLSFAHGMLWESVERSAGDARRLRRHHRICAEMLEKSYLNGSLQIAERRGEHLMRAGELGFAIAPLLEGAKARANLGEYRTAYTLFDRREEAMKALGVSASDERWADGWLARAHVLSTHNRLDEAQVLVDRVLEVARHHNWRRSEAVALRELGLLRFTHGATAEALEAYQDALRRFDGLDAAQDEADCYLNMGRAYYFRSQHVEAEAALRRAMFIQQEIGDSVGRAKAMRMLGNIFGHQGDTALSAHTIEQALEVFQAWGHRFLVAACLNDLGEVHRLYGNPADAEGYYRRSADAYVALDNPSVSTPRINLSLLLIAKGDFYEAQRVLEMERERQEKHGTSLDLPWIYAGLSPCAAGLQDWARLDKVLNRVDALLVQTGVVDPDIPSCLERAATLAFERRQPELARRAGNTALTQLRALNDAEGVRRVTAFLGG